MVCFLVSLAQDPLEKRLGRYRRMTTTHTTGPLIEVRGLEKTFGDNHVLKGVDLMATEGTATALIGPSGSGKTTILRSLNVLETPDTGTIRIADAAVDFGDTSVDKKARRREVEALRARSGMVFQSHNLFPHKTVLQNLLEGPVQVQGRNVDEATADARKLLEQVGLTGREDRYPAQLSGRPAAARRHRPGAGPEPAGGAPRRAHLGARPRAGRRGAGRRSATSRPPAGPWRSSPTRSASRATSRTRCSSSTRA